MPARGKSLIRFVQLRRLTDTPAQPDTTCQAAQDAVPHAIDFSTAWSDPVRDAIAQRDRPRAIALYRARRDELTPARKRVARLAMQVLHRATLDQRFTLADVREMLQRWSARYRLTVEETYRALWDTGTWAVDIILLSRWLRSNETGALNEPLRVLRGLAILRLLSATDSDGCIVRVLMRDRSIELPTPPRTSPAEPGTIPLPIPAARSARRLAALRHDVRRLQARATTQSRIADPTVAELVLAGYPDLRRSIADLQRATTHFGLPDSIRLSRVCDVLDVEYASLRGKALAAADARLAPPLEGDLDDLLEPGDVIQVPFDPGELLVPVLDAEARVLGRGDLMLLRTEHLRYEVTEISYIENVLASEVRGRLHVVDAATIDTVVQSTQALSESTQDLETTEHNGLERAAEEANETTNTLSLGVSVSGGFGPVKAGIEIGAGQTTSTSASNSSAVSYAKDVTERASELLRSSESFKRTTTTKTRVTETNEHKFDNASGTVNIAGVYRWVDKVDQAQMFNYGERLLLEFIVPEPAAQLVAMQSVQASSTTPIPPLPFELEANDVGTDNYVAKGARWNVLGLEPPPLFQQFVAWTMVDPAANQFDYPPDSEVTQPEWGYASYAHVLPVPDGYKACIAYVTTTWGVTTSGSDLAEKQDVQVAVGDQRIAIGAGFTGETYTLELDVERAGPVPVIVSSDQKWGAAVSIRVLCERTDEAFDAWQLATYEIIKRGYLDQKAAFDSAMRVIASRQVFAATTAPDANRLIEALELKRGCQTILTGQEFVHFGALTDSDIPRIERHESLLEGEIIQFFEDCFEWENITYLFYPYQWAGRDRWSELLARSSTDPLHQAFLRSGAARVVVPVREGFERAVGSYLATSEVPVWDPKPWRGKGSPYPPIDDLIADANDRPGDEVAIGDPWEVVTPTSLIYLQAGSELNPALASRRGLGTGVRADTQSIALPRSG